MKIGIYAPFYHPFEGGAERVARRVALEMAGRHDVTVFTFQYRPDLASEERDGPALVRRFPYQETRPFGLTRVTAPALLEALEAADLDVLQLHGVIFPNVAVAVTRTLRRRGIPVVLVPHGLFEAYQGDAKQPLARRLLSLALVRPLLGALLWRSSQVALLSPEDQRLLDRYRLPARRSTVVYNGFEPPLTASASAARFRGRHGLEGKTVILHVASVKPNKGHDVMVRAMAQLAAERPDLQYVAVGNMGGLWDGYAEQLRRLIGDSGVADHVTLVGHVSDEELADAYAAADIAVLPSLSETFPLTVLDAMAWGKPVIATRVGGVAHMITDGQNGLLTPPGDAGALAAALRQVLDDAGLRQRLSEQAARSVRERFDWGQVIDRYEDICFRLAPAPAGAR